MVTQPPAVWPSKPVIIFPSISYLARKIGSLCANALAAIVGIECGARHIQPFQVPAIILGRPPRIFRLRIMNVHATGAYCLGGRHQRLISVKAPMSKREKINAMANTRREKTLEELKKDAVAVLERRGYAVQGKTLAQIRKMLRPRLVKPKSGATSLGREIAISRDKHKKPNSGSRLDR